MAAPPPADQGLLVTHDLTVRIGFSNGWVPVVEDLTIRIGHGEIVGLVGESGCGKSMTALAILGSTPSVARVSGSILLGERELVGLSDREMRSIRGVHVGYVAQDATVALDPVITVGAQICEAIRAHTGASRRDALARAADLLHSVGITEPKARLAAYPHQLSGGMRQRVVIAIALSLDPELIVADEPTTALDVTVQAQIMDVLLSAATSRRASVLLISHDLRLVGAVTDRVNVMYAGRIVEQGKSRELMRSPSHPYTHALLESTPRVSGTRADRLHAIQGRPPDPRMMPPGCRFHPRCPEAQAKCRETEPSLGAVAPGAACWFPLTSTRGAFDRTLS